MLKSLDLYHYAVLRMSSYPNQLSSERWWRREGSRPRPPGKLRKSNSCLGMVETETMNNCEDSIDDKTNNDSNSKSDFVFTKNYRECSPCGGIGAGSICFERSFTNDKYIVSLYKNKENVSIHKMDNSNLNSSNNSSGYNNSYSNNSNYNNSRYNNSDYNNSSYNNSSYNNSIYNNSNYTNGNYTNGNYNNNYNHNDSSYIRNNSHSNGDICDNSNDKFLNNSNNSNENVFNSYNTNNNENPVHKFSVDTTSGSSGSGSTSSSSSSNSSGGTSNTNGSSSRANNTDSSDSSALSSTSIGCRSIRACLRSITATTTINTSTSTSTTVISTRQATDNINDNGSNNNNHKIDISLSAAETSHTSSNDSMLSPSSTLQIGSSGSWPSHPGSRERTFSDNIRENPDIKKDMQLFNTIQPLKYGTRGYPRILLVSRRYIRKHKYINFIGEYHLDLIQRFGGAPVIVPRTSGTFERLEMYFPIDGFMITEGEDLGTFYRPYGNDYYFNTNTDSSSSGSSSSGYISCSNEEETFSNIRSFSLNDNELRTAASSGRFAGPASVTEGGKYDNYSSLEHIRRQIPLKHASNTNVDENKDAIEWELLRRCYDMGIPFLGICRGAQMLNVIHGGTLYFDIEQEVPNSVKHIDYENNDNHRHNLNVVESTPLADWFYEQKEGSPESSLPQGASFSISVNSYHHQGVKRLARRFAGMGYSDDGLVEAFYDPLNYHPSKGIFVVGLQFHPERMAGDYPGCVRVYKDFMEACWAYRASRLSMYN